MFLMVTIKLLMLIETFLKYKNILKKKNIDLIIFFVTIFLKL